MRLIEKFASRIRMKIQLEEEEEEGVGVVQKKEMHQVENEKLSAKKKTTNSWMIESSN